VGRTLLSVAFDLALGLGLAFDFRTDRIATTANTTVEERRFSAA
jgi:hypothetical protein